MLYSLTSLYGVPNRDAASSVLAALVTTWKWQASMTMAMAPKLFQGLLVAIALSPCGSGAVHADEQRPPAGWRAAVDAVVMSDIARILAEPIVEYTTVAQNARYGTLAQGDIDALDTQWREERDRDNQPLIAAVLSNPTSSYLTRVQAQSIGLYSEIFVMDRNGLNVGQSNISSDFWQGDEAKFQETYDQGAGAVFVDAPEFREDIGVWVVQVNVSVDRDGAPIGASTFEVNLTELARRRAAVDVQG